MNIKSMSKIVVGIILGLIVFAISAKIIVFLVSVISALGLGAINIHVYKNQDVLKDVEAVANILGFIGGAYLFVKTYKLFTKKRNKGDSSI